LALTPEQLAASRSNYDQWRQRSGKAFWWTPQAASAANAAGLHPNLMGKALEGWREEFTPWGENVWINPQGQAGSIADPKWSTFVHDYMSQHPGDTQSVQDTYNTPVAGAGTPAPTTAIQPAVAGGGHGADINSGLDISNVSAPANPISLNPNGLDLASALNLFKKYNTSKSQVDIGNTSKYYNPVQFRGFSLI
jgi:hypothetical protein